MTEGELRDAIYFAAATLATTANTSGKEASLELWLDLVEKNFKLQMALHDYLVMRRHEGAKL